MSLEAEASANVCTFHISSSISIVLYGEFCYDYSDGIINPNFSAVMDVLGIYIDTEKLEKFYFDQPVGEGDIWAIGDYKNNCMVFDLYRDLTDEFDVIVFAVICREEISNRIYELLSAIKEETQPQIAFAEYDIREKKSWLQDVISGEDHNDGIGYHGGKFTQKIRYAESFADFCTQNNI